MADPDPVNEPCYTHQSAHVYRGATGALFKTTNYYGQTRVAGTREAGVICVARGTCDATISSNQAYYVGGCRVSRGRASEAIASTSQSTAHPTLTEGCAKAGECNLPYIEQMMDWTATGGHLNTSITPDFSMARLLNGSTSSGEGCSVLYPALAATVATNKVSMAVVVSGTIEAYTAAVLSAMKRKIAIALTVAEDDVTVTAVSGSVIITTEVATTSSSSASVQNSMNTLMGTTATAGDVLTTHLLAVTASTVIAPTTSAASATVSYSLNADGTLAFSESTAAPPPPPESTGVSTAVIIIIIGAVVGIGLGLAVLFYMMKKTPKTEPGTKGVA